MGNTLFFIMKNKLFLNLGIITIPIIISYLAGMGIDAIGIIFIAFFTDKSELPYLFGIFHIIILGSSIYWSIKLWLKLIQDKNDGKNTSPIL